jgi:hypothetical protein
MLTRKQIPLWLVVAIMGILLAGVIAAIGITQKHRKLQMGELAKACRSKSGTWLESYRECEYVDREWCTGTGGRFDECGSACRHSPDPATPCTMQCIPVCVFSGEGLDPDGKGKLPKSDTRAAAGR